MPNLNDVIEASGQRFGAQRRSSAYAQLKKKWSGTIMLLARSQGFICREGGHFTYIFHEPNRKRDPSNFIAGGVKLIEDALQDALLLENDGWTHVQGIRVRWVHNKTFAGVVVIVTDEAPRESDIDRWAQERPTNSA